MTQQPSTRRVPSSRALPLAQVPEGCPFCREAAIAAGLLAETTHFLVVCDRAPLAPGHLLLIPRAHLACYGALPRQWDEEFHALKARVATFLAATYGPPVFFEHGLVAQAVPHAHLHAVPLADTDALRAWLAAWPARGRPRAARRVRGLAGLRRWYAERGPYLYYEAEGQAHVLSPDGAPEGALRTAVAAALAPTRPTPEAVEALTREVRARWRQHEAAQGRTTTRVVSCFLAYQGRLCLLQRSAAVGSGRGKWHIVSGYLPDGKDPLHHAFDEVAEETGLTRDHITLCRRVGPLFFPDRDGERTWEVHAFLFAVATPALTLNWEHDRYAWVAPDALAEYDCFPWLRALYEAVVAGGDVAPNANSRP